MKGFVMALEALGNMIASRTGQDAAEVQGGRLRQGSRARLVARRIGRQAHGINQGRQCSQGGVVGHYLFCNHKNGH